MGGIFTFACKVTKSREQIKMNMFFCRIFACMRFCVCHTSCHIKSMPFRLYACKSAQIVNVSPKYNVLFFVIR